MTNIINRKYKEEEIEMAKEIEETIQKYKEKGLTIDEISSTIWDSLYTYNNEYINRIFWDWKSEN